MRRVEAAADVSSASASCAASPSGVLRGRRRGCRRGRRRRGCGRGRRGSRLRFRFRLGLRLLRCRDDGRRRRRGLAVGADPADQERRPGREPGVCGRQPEGERGAPPAERLARAGIDGRLRAQDAPRADGNGLPRADLTGFAFTASRVEVGSQPPTGAVARRRDEIGFERARADRVAEQPPHRPRVAVPPGRGGSAATRRADVDVVERQLRRRVEERVAVVLWRSAAATDGPTIAGTASRARASRARRRRRTARERRPRRVRSLRGPRQRTRRGSWPAGGSSAQGNRGFQHQPPIGGISRARLSAKKRECGGSLPWRGMRLPARSQ